MSPKNNKKKKKTGVGVIQGHIINLKPVAKFVEQDPRGNGPDSQWKAMNS